MIGKTAILALLGIVAPRASDERVHDAKNRMAVALADHHLSMKAATGLNRQAQASLNVEAQETGLREDKARLQSVIERVMAAGEDIRALSNDVLDRTRR